MRTSILFVAATAALSAGCAGPRSCRYVYQDGRYGVVGIPENSDRWPTRYRSRAEGLMERHFPEGHEVVRAEEVVQGTRTTTTEGSSVAELAPALPLELLEVCKLGRTATRTQCDATKIKECRIIYRRVDRPDEDEYAASALLTPLAYVDPNAGERPEEPASGLAGRDEAPGDHGDPE